MMGAGLPLALLLAASLPMAASAPARIDACALLDAGQIERVVGQKVDAGVNHDAGMETNGAWSSSCVWMFAAAASADRPTPRAARGFVMLNAMQWPHGSGRAHEFLDSFRDAAAQGVLSHAPSPRQLGDEALWWGDGLAVRKNDVSFGLSVHAPRITPKVPGTAEERLAPLILKKLDGRSPQPSASNSLRS